MVHFSRLNRIGQHVDGTGIWKAYRRWTGKIRTKYAVATEEDWNKKASQSDGSRAVRCALYEPKSEKTG